MALDLESEQKLTKVGLVSYFHSNQAGWMAAAEECHKYVVKSFPAGSIIRPDDVAKVLTASVSVDTALNAFLDKKKLTQKFWIARFADLVVERYWSHKVRNL